jgi:hypothetical protein
MFNGSFDGFDDFTRRSDMKCRITYTEDTCKDKNGKPYYNLVLHIPDPEIFKEAKRLLKLLNAECDKGLICEDSTITIRTYYRPYSSLSGKLRTGIRQITSSSQHVFLSFYVKYHPIVELKEGLVPGYSGILQKLVNLLGLNQLGNEVDTSGIPAMTRKPLIIHLNKRWLDEMLEALKEAPKKAHYAILTLMRAHSHENLPLPQDIQRYILGWFLRSYGRFSNVLEYLKQHYYQDQQTSNLENNWISSLFKPKVLPDSFKEAALTLSPNPLVKLKDNIEASVASISASWIAWTERSSSVHPSSKPSEDVKDKKIELNQLKVKTIEAPQNPTVQPYDTVFHKEKIDNQKQDAPQNKQPDAQQNNQDVQRPAATLDSPNGSSSK